MGTAIKRIVVLSFLLVLLFGTASAQLSLLTLRKNPDNVVYVESLRDDDESIGFVELFVVREAEVVERYNYEDVVTGQELLDVGEDTQGLYYNFMDRDGSMENLGVFIVIEGDIIPCIDCPEYIGAFMSVRAVPRLNEDATAYEFDLEAVVKAEYVPFVTAVSFRPLQHKFGESWSYKSFQMEQDTENVALWKATYGPLDEEYYFRFGFYPTYNPIGGTILRGSSARPTWVQLTMCVEEELQLEAKPVPIKDSIGAAYDSTGALYLAGAGYSNIEMLRNQYGDVWAAFVDDDDDSIQLVTIHIIVDGLDTTYNLTDVMVGDRLNGIIPDGAIAYYNFMDFDGTMFNMQTLRSFEYEYVSIPAATVISKTELEAVLASDELSYRLRAKVYIKDGYSPERVDLFYKLEGSSSSFRLAMEQESPGVYALELGPYTGYTGILTRIYPISPDPGELRYKAAGLGWRDFYLFAAPDCPDANVSIIDCTVLDPPLECGDMPEEICNNGLDDDGDSLIDEPPCIEREEEEEAPEWVLKVEKEQLMVGEVQRIWVEDVVSSEKISDVKVVVSDGEENILSTGESGVLEYRVKSEGTYHVLATKGSFESEITFRGLVLLTSVLDYLSSAATLVFGSTALESPLLLILLLILCIIVALLAFDKSRLLFEERVKSTTQKRKETVIRTALAAIAFVIPVVGSNLVSIYAGIALAVVEIVGIFLSSYFLQMAKAGKPIKV